MLDLGKYNASFHCTDEPRVKQPFDFISRFWVSHMFLREDYVIADGLEGERKGVSRGYVARMCHGRACQESVSRAYVTWNFLGSPHSCKICCICTSNNNAARSTLQDGGWLESTRMG